jgi:peroxiredoxin Q/BCP
MFTRSTTRKVAPIVALMAALTMSALAAETATPPSVGEKAKDFTLKTLDNKDVQLSALLKEGPVVLVVLRGWVGYQCPVCTKQVGQLIGKAKDITASGAQVVFVYPGPANNLKDHAQEFVTGKTIPEHFYFVEDPDLKLVDDYGIHWNAKGENAYPSTFVIDKEGKIVWKKVSDNHGDRASAKEIIAALPK